jgi:hypothetical protein
MQECLIVLARNVKVLNQPLEAGPIERGGTEFEEKVKACAEQNISATQEFVRELSYAKDIQDMLRIRAKQMVAVHAKRFS